MFPVPSRSSGRFAASMILMMSLGCTAAERAQWADSAQAGESGCPSCSVGLAEDLTAPALWADGSGWGVRVDVGGRPLDVSTRSIGRSGHVRLPMSGGEVWRSGLFPPIGAAAGEPAWNRSLGAGVVEHWAPAGRGWEQGWTVEDRPSGDGPLVVEVSTRGLDWHTVRNEGLVGTDELGVLWSVSGVHAEDAAGRALDVGLNATASGFDLAVDDDDAEYPLIIDPVYSAVGFTITDVSSTGGEPCDFDGDGFDDLIASQSGLVRVVFGHPDGYKPLRGRVFAGSSGWCLGDYTGDGLDELGIQAVGSGGGYILDVYNGSGDGLSVGVYATLSPRSSSTDQRDQVDTQGGRGVLVALHPSINMNRPDCREVELFTYG